MPSDAALRLVVARALEVDIVAVEGLAALSGGTSRVTWSLDAVDAAGRRHPLILQCQRTLTWGSGLDVEAEAGVLLAAFGVGAPVARLRGWDAGPEVLGSPYLLLDRVEGETIPQRLLRQARFTRARPLLARQYGQALASLQRVPVGQLDRLAHEDPPVKYRRILDDIAVAHPALELGFRWLDAHRVHPAGEVLVHGDYRNGNGIVGDDGLLAVIDFELAHIGDPLEDLGWFCLRAWRFGETPQAGGFGSVDELVGGYEDGGGARVDRDALRWWQVLGTVRWAVICMMQGATQLSGHRRSIELAAVGRRTPEPELDLLLLLP